MVDVEPLVLDGSSDATGDGDQPPVPEWGGPPEHVVPGLAPLALLLGTSEHVTVHLTNGFAYPSGVSLTLTAQMHDPSSSLDIGTGLCEDLLSDTPRDGGLWWGLDLPDGQHLTCCDPRPETEHPNYQQLFKPEAATWQPDHAALMVNAGSATAVGVRVEYWLWPLPTAGVMTFHCRWPQEGIDTSTALQAQYLRTTAARARPR